VTSNYDMLKEFVNIRRESFDRLDTYQQRVNYLRQRLDKTPFKMEERAYVWLALQGIAKEYPDLYNRSLTNIQADRLTWSDLMAELQQLSVTEAAQPAMTSVKLDKKTSTTNRGNNNSNHADNDAGSEDRVTCSVCNRSIWKDTKHCHGCGWHNRGDVCWRCEPEKAPDHWKQKKQWLRKKAKNQTSTTGPLHQQSGNANPSSDTDPLRSTLKKTDDGDTKKILFQTSSMALTAMDVSAFREGPQRI
jgi:hypothetical protein